MRPLRLSLQAFGSYAGSQMFDLARLGGHGVFSITGPTGAGKSTIFDALVYALYDELPGFRKNSHIRSQFADPNTPTEVTLDFEAAGELWTITRSPTQDRPRKHGDGPPVTQAMKVRLASLDSDDGGITRATEVGRRVEELVGLTRAQFEQVVLIPQGRFEQALKADTKNRAELLGRLFPVDLYRRTTAILKEKESALRTAFEEIEATRRQIVQSIDNDLDEAERSLPGRLLGVDRSDDWPDGDSLDTESPGDPSPEAAVSDPPASDAPVSDPPASDAGQVAVRVGALHSHLDTLVAEGKMAADQAEAARVAREAAEADALAWQQWQDDLKSQANFASERTEDDLAAQELRKVAAVRSVAPSLEGWRTADSDLATAIQRCTELGARYDVDMADGAPLPTQASEAATLAERLRTAATALEEAEVERMALQSDGDALDSDEQQLAEKFATLDVKDEDLKKLSASLEQIDLECEEARQQSSLEPAALAEVTRVDNALTSARMRHQAASDVDRLTAQTQEAVAEAEVEARKLTDTYAAWRAGQAGRLAQSLVPGEPCPTCGSADHPMPASAVSTPITDAELTAAEASNRTASERAGDLRVELAEAEGRLAAIEVGPSPEELEVELSGAKASLAEAEAATKKLAHLLERQQAEHARLTEETANVTQARSSLESTRTGVAVRRTTWEERRSQFLIRHGSLDSMTSAAAARSALARLVEDLRVALGDRMEAEQRRDLHLGTLRPVIAECAVEGPANLATLLLTDAQFQAEEARLATRAAARDKVTQRIDEYRVQGRPVDRPDPAPLVESETTAANARDHLVGLVATIKARLAAIEQRRGELADAEVETASAMRAQDEAATVAAVCAGNAASLADSRRSLETWVLAYYLRQVTGQANRRLEVMSQGRYLLQVSEETEDRRRATGLDLSVIDAETGQTRPVSTLSGGETFLAALALALGLADVVSAGSNTTIGALFIDEGFGSLDTDTLEGVVEVLRSLQDGGRMVGVISHVQEVKDAVPNGIAVTTSSKGSDADITYPDD